MPPHNMTMTVTRAGMLWVGWFGFNAGSALAAGVFASQNLGMFSGNGFADGITTVAGQVAVQAIGVGSTLAYTVVVTFVLLKVADLTLGLRASVEEETQGLDITQHEERGYDL